MGSLCSIIIGKPPSCQGASRAHSGIQCGRSKRSSWVGAYQFNPQLGTTLGARSSFATRFENGWYA
jgi:hypothetical protein